MTLQRLPIKPSCIKTRFALGFLRALKRLRRNRPTSSSSSSSSPREIFGGYRTVKMAADASMASAVGSRRAWSRAMLWKIRCQKAQRKRRSSGGFRWRRRGNLGNRYGFRRTDELRNLVPGGEAMDFCSLLDETAHYIQCLTTQVQVMRNIVDFCTYA